MDDEKMIELADRFLGAWNTQEVDRVLSCYTEDLVYRDPNTRGPIHGRAAMRRYLCRLFAAWQMVWTRRDARRFADGRGCTVTWRASFRRVDSTVRVEFGGIDLVELRGGRIAVNEVYFDRTALGAAAPIFALVTNGIENKGAR